MFWLLIGQLRHMQPMLSCSCRVLMLTCFLKIGFKLCNGCEKTGLFFCGFYFQRKPSIMWKTEEQFHSSLTEEWPKYSKCWLSVAVRVVHVIFYVWAHVVERCWATVFNATATFLWLVLSGSLLPLVSILKFRELQTDILLHKCCTYNVTICLC